MIDSFYLFFSGEEGGLREQKQSFWEKAILGQNVSQDGPGKPKYMAAMLCWEFELPTPKLHCGNLKDWKGAGFTLSSLVGKATSSRFLSFLP